MAPITRKRRARTPYPTVQAWMDATGTTQLMLAKQLGIRQPHLCNVLQKSRKPSLTLAMKLSRIANCPLEAVVGDDILSEISGI